MNFDMIVSKRSVILILISIFIIFFAAMIIVAFIPEYLISLGTHKHVLQLIITIFLSTLSIFPHFLGKYSDKIQNRHYFIIIGTAGMIVTPFLLVFTENLILITIILIFFGIFASSSSIFFTLYTELVQNDSKWISYYNALSALGWYLGVQIGGIFIDVYDISNVFLLSFIVFLGSIVFVIFIKEDRELILKHNKEINNQGFDSPLENNPEEKTLISRSIYLGIFFRCFGLAPILTIIVVLMGIHLTSSTEVGFLIGLNPLLQFFLMILLGKILNDKNNRFFMLLGYGLGVFVIFGYIFSSNFWSFFITQFLLSFSYSVYWMTTLIYISKKSTPQNKGRYIGYANTSAFAGNAVGGLFFTLLLTIFNSDYYVAMYFMISFPVIALIIIFIQFHLKNKLN